MKKLFLMLITALPGMLFARADTTYSIKGHFDNVKQAVKTVYLLRMTGMRQVIDSAQVINNGYTLTGNVTVGERVIMLDYKFGSRLPDANSLCQFFLAAETFKITHTNNFNEIVVDGSAANGEYKKLSEAANLYADENERREKVYGNFIRKNPSSPLAFYALKEYAGQGHHIDGAKVKQLFDLLPENIRQSEPGRELSDKITTAVNFDTNASIGVAAPNFTLNDTTGMPVKLSSYRGKYVLLDFWASWCTPCRQENPTLVSAYKQYHDKGFNILSVSLDFGKQKSAWLRAIKHDNLTAWTHVADLEHSTNPLVKLYGIEGIPQNFLIDPDGKIIGRNLRGAALEQKLREIFKN